MLFFIAIDTPITASVVVHVIVSEPVDPAGVITFVATLMPWFAVLCCGVYPAGSVVSGVPAPSAHPTAICTSLSVSVVMLGIVADAAAGGASVFAVPMATS